MALTKLDVLDGLDKVAIGVSYSLNDSILTDPPAFASDMSLMKVNYEWFDGWTGTIGCRTWDDLHPNARTYIQAIERLMNVPGRFLQWLM